MFGVENTHCPARRAARLAGRRPLTFLSTVTVTARSSVGTQSRQAEFQRRRARGRIRRAARGADAVELTQPARLVRLLSGRAPASVARCGWLACGAGDIGAGVAAGREGVPVRMARIADPGSFTFQASNAVLGLELVRVPLPPGSATGEVDADGNITIAVSSIQATDVPFAVHQNVAGFDVSVSGTSTVAARFVSGRLDPGSGAMSLAGSLFASVTFTATGMGVTYSGTCAIGGSAPADQIPVTVTTDPPGTPYSQQTGTVTLTADLRGLGNAVVCDPALPNILPILIGPGELTIPGTITPILVQGAPVVTGVAPASGSAIGDQVTITGEAFTGATGVWFGAARAPAMTVDSDSQITAGSPPGAGIVDVTVTTPGGTSATSPADRYAYTPVVNGVGPSSGSAVGGDTVTIVGAGFTGATGVRFGPAAAPNMTVDSDMQITAVSPPGTGPVDVTVTTPGGTSATNSADQFIYPPSGVPPPVVNAITPPSGSAAGGDAVTVIGAMFTGATGVWFGVAAAPAMTVDFDAQITATSPPGTGLVDVTVTTPGGTSATSPADQFTYL